MYTSLGPYLSRKRQLCTLVFDQRNFVVTLMNITKEAEDCHYAAMSVAKTYLYFTTIQTFDSFVTRQEFNLRHNGTRPVTTETRCKV